MASLQLVQCSSQVLVKRMPALAVMSSHRREIHDSYLPSGRGGRSSFSGIVATVFGGTGFVGATFLNRLGRLGSNIMLPYRPSYDKLHRVKVMSDLGQMLYREYTIKEDDEKIMELIEHSNCVVNLIGSQVPYNRYSLKEVNLDWPLRLARLVAEKNDGTRLVHLTNLNCTQEEGRKMSKVLNFNHRAEIGMREIYPNTIIVRSANIFGYQDTYTNFFLNTRFQDIAKLGALPILYDNGTSTLTQPVYVGDVAEALVRILKHLDAPGQTFELVGPGRYLLKDFVEYLYKVVQRECYMYDSLGPMDQSKANFVQRGIQKALDFYFERQKQPRFFIPRFWDMMSRRVTPYEQWTTKDYFQQVHLSDEVTGEIGLEELGIQPTHFEDKAYFMHGWVNQHEKYTTPDDENFPPLEQYDANAPKITTRVVPKIEG